jgi:integrase/recombinase XerD
MKITERKQSKSRTPFDELPLAVQSYLLSRRASSRKTLWLVLEVVADQWNEPLAKWQFEAINATKLERLRVDMEDNGYSPSTVNFALSALRGVAHEAYKLKQMDFESFYGIKLVKNSRGSRELRGRCWTDDEIAKVIRHCVSKGGEKDIRDAAIFAVCFGAGLRRSEAAALTLDSIQFKTGTIKLIGKGNKGRTVPCPEWAMKIQQLWGDLRGEKPGFWFIRYYKGNRRIRNAEAEGIAGQSIYDVFITRGKECGLGSIPPHDARRTYITNALDLVDLMTVCKWVGHSDPQTTKRYDLRDLAEKTPLINQWEIQI